MEEVWREVCALKLQIASYITLDGGWKGLLFRNMGDLENGVLEGGKGSGKGKHRAGLLPTAVIIRQTWVLLGFHLGPLPAVLVWEQTGCMAEMGSIPHCRCGAGSQELIQPGGRAV